MASSTLRQVCINNLSKWQIQITECLTSSDSSGTTPPLKWISKRIYLWVRWYEKAQDKRERNHWLMQSIFYTTLYVSNIYCQNLVNMPQHIHSLLEIGTLSAGSFLCLSSSIFTLDSLQTTTGMSFYVRFFPTVSFCGIAGWGVFRCEYDTIWVHICKALLIPIYPNITMLILPWICI